ncbi:MAG: hypothetical protein ACRC6M_19590, partial [Microcystaceae cyanobacterium]
MTRSLKVRPGRFLFTIGTSVVLTFPYGLQASAQKMPSFAPAPWAKPQSAPDSATSPNSLPLPNSSLGEAGATNSPFPSSPLTTEPVFPTPSEEVATKALNKFSGVPSTKGTKLMQGAKNKGGNYIYEATPTSRTPKMIDTPIAENNNIVQTPT